MESQSETTQTVSALKLPVLKTGEYDLWSMRMEQYLTFTDHALWEVIVNGDSVSPVASASTGAEAIPDEHLLKFHACKDAKSLWEAIKNRFGGNKESKKMQKTILKQNYENFVALSQEGLDKTYDSLPSAWNNIALITRNKSDIDTLSMDDLYNNLKSNAPQLDYEDLEQIDDDDLEEMDLKWQVAMLTMRVKRLIKKTGRKIDLNDKETVSFNKKKVECYNYHRRGHFARECRAPRNKGNKNRDAPIRNAPVDTSTTNALVVQDGIGGYDWSFQAEEGLTNFALMAYTSQGYQMGLESLEARIVVHEKNEAVYEEDIAFLKYDVQVKDISIKDLKNQLEEALKEKDDLKLKLEKFKESSKNLTILINSQIMFNNRESNVDDSLVIDRFKTGEGFHAVPPPYTRNYMPSRPDLSFAGLDDSVYKTKVSETKTSISKTSKDIVEKPKTVRPSAPIIEDWDTDSDNDSVFRPKSDQTKPKFTKINFVKSGENDQGIFDSGCSRHMTGNKSFLTDYQEIDGRFVAFGGSPKGDKMEVGTTTNNNLTARLPLLNPGDYDLWLMRIEQYFLITDYSLWEVIKNGNKVLKRMVGTVKQEYEPTSVEETTQEKRYGGNKESKKVQRTLLKQQYKNFAALSSESLDQTFNELQKLFGQLEIQGEVINQEDMNLKLLRSLPSEWKYHALIWRNKVEIETISLDDLYNNLKIYEPKLTGSSNTSQNTQNVAFVSNSTNNTNNTHKADDSSHEISSTQSTTHTHHNGSNTVCLDNLCDAVICAFLAKKDLQWEMAMLTIRARRFIKRTGKQLNINGQRVGFDKSKVECFKCHKHGHFAREYYQAEEETTTNHALGDGILHPLEAPLVQESEGLESVEARLVYYKKNETVLEDSINVLKLEVRLRDNALDVYKLNLEKAEAERDQLKQTLEKFQNSSKSLNEILECQVIDKFKKGLGYDAATAASPAVEGFVNLTDKSGSDKAYHAVPPPLSGNFLPGKPDLTFIDEIVESENLDVTTVVTPSNEKTVENKGVFNTVESNTVRRECCAPINEELVSDGKKKTVVPTIPKVDVVRPKQQEKPVRKTVKYAEMYSFDHLQYTCKQKRQLNGQREEKPVWNNARRVNHQNSQRITHPNPKRHMVPRKILTRSGPIICCCCSRQVNTARQKAVVNAIRTNWVNAVKTLACWVWRPVKPNSASITLKKYDYVDARGRSRSVMAWVPKKFFLVRLNVDPDKIPYYVMWNISVWSKDHPDAYKWIEANGQWLYDNFDHCEVETSDDDDDARSLWSSDDDEHFDPFEDDPTHPDARWSP
ncbi:ribonuclease H-like domain-containing protein [Tanacetum coccineum]